MLAAAMLCTLPVRGGPRTDGGRTARDRRGQRRELHLQLARLPARLVGARAWVFAADRCSTASPSASSSATTGFAEPLRLGPGGTLTSALCTANLLWGAVESLRYYALMRRRLRLGLADPLVTNRFLLWGLGIGAAGVGSLISVVGAGGLGLQHVRDPGPDPQQLDVRPRLRGPDVGGLRAAGRLAALHPRPGRLGAAPASGAARGLAPCFHAGRPRAARRRNACAVRCCSPTRGVCRGCFRAPGSRRGRPSSATSSWGADSSVWYGCVLRGDVHSIRVGARTNLQDGSVVHVTAGRFAGGDRRRGQRRPSRRGARLSRGGGRADRDRRRSCSTAPRSARKRSSEPAPS